MLPRGLTQDHQGAHNARVPRPGSSVPCPGAGRPLRPRRGRCGSTPRSAGRVQADGGSRAGLGVAACARRPRRCDERAGDLRAARVPRSHRGWAPRLGADLRARDHPCGGPGGPRPLLRGAHGRRGRPPRAHGHPRWMLDRRAHQRRGRAAPRVGARDRGAHQGPPQPHQPLADGGCATHRVVRVAVRGSHRGLRPGAARARSTRRPDAPRGGLRRAARHLGASVLGISLVTNLAAGVSPTPLNHAEVLEAGAAAAPRLGTLLDGVLTSL